MDPALRLDLHALVHPLDPKAAGITEIIDPHTGTLTPLPAGARLQQRNLAQDDRQTSKLLLTEIGECKATLESDIASEVEKAEARDRLEQLYPVAAACSSSAKEGAQKAAKTVRRTIHRLHDSLLAEKDENGNPHPVLRPFAEHLYKYILLPSGRHAGLTGQLVYEPPPGVIWQQ